MDERALVGDGIEPPIGAGRPRPTRPAAGVEALDDELMAVAVVEPDAAARERLLELLAGVGHLEVLLEGGSGEELLRLLGRRRVDLVFLETRLPDVDGLDLLETLRQQSGAAVVVIGPAERALRAFELGALDFLEKPIDPGRLLRSLIRARGRFAAARTIELGRHLLAALENREPRRPARPRRLLLRVAADRQRIFEPDDICWVDAAGNYVWVNCAEERHRVREGIGAIEKLLDPGKFLRIHRSTIVNIDRILEVRTRRYGDCLLVLENGKRFNVGRTYKDRVLELLGVDESPLQPLAAPGSRNGSRATPSKLLDRSRSSG